MDTQNPAAQNDAAGTENTMTMQLNPVTLHFTGTCAHLERDFQRHYHAQSLRPMRIALFLALALYALFGILDAILIPEAKHFTWLVRFAVVCPATLLLMLSTWHNVSERLIQPLLALLIVIGGAGIIVIILVAPPPASHTYYAGLILVFMLGYTFVRAQFVWASLSAWIVVLLYEIIAVGFVRIPLTVLIGNNFFFISANFIGMAACYAIERAARRDYYLGQLLSQEQEKVREANRLLEARVEERTADLASSHRELSVEMQERKRAEAERLRLATQLKQAEKMEAIGSLAAGMAHDLNNILCGLVGYPDLLLLNIPANSPLRQDILSIKRSGEKAAAMVQDLLTMARRGVDNQEVFNPNALITDYLASPEFRNLQQRHPHVDFDVDLDETLLNVFASPIHFSKSLMNLVSNAAEAQLVSGKVALVTRNQSIDQPYAGYETILPGNYATIRVSDTGVGIDPSVLHRIFEPFFTKKRMGRSGTGLGMSVVWATLKDAGGYIDVSSREGHGTSFTLFFPITRKVAHGDKPRVVIEDYRGTERILVVDDMADQRAIAHAMLRKMGYTVDAVTSGEAALAFVKKTPVDLLVLGMLMDPGMDGCDTYREIIALYPEQKAIIASGYSESERVCEVQQLGAGVHVRKPYTLESLAVAVREELDRSAE
ncbi:putative Histidine kinase [Desulfosarcina cetonica]|uniref:ATP-binding protein n=1 Tax=Desulfosarcina cetonica TaxID=90730 RepID=UPI0006D0BC49|nr:ATP-binding protein [Desulfosarcina cetonica]VTR65837.1 putative Histidine kinase [Desulfosarcina cetonica]